MPQSHDNQVIGSPGSDKSSWFPQSTTKTWTIVIVFGVILLFALLFGLACWFITIYVNRCISSRTRKRTSNNGNGSKKRDKYVNSIHVNDDILGAKNIAVAGTGAFRDGVITNEISGLSGHSTRVLTPLVVRGGLHFTIIKIDESKTQLYQSAIYRFVSPSNSVQQQGLLPLAHLNKGSIIFVENASGYATIQLNTQGNDTFNNSSPTSITIPVWAQLVSNGDNSWLVQIIS